MKQIFIISENSAYVYEGDEIFTYLNFLIEKDAHPKKFKSCDNFDNFQADKTVEIYKDWKIEIEKYIHSEADEVHYLVRRQFHD